MINFLLVWSTKGLVKNLKASWLTVAVRCRDSSITSRSGWFCFVPGSRTVFIYSTAARGVIQYNNKLCCDQVSVYRTETIAPAVNSELHLKHNRNRNSSASNMKLCLLFYSSVGRKSGIKAPPHPFLTDFTGMD